jgi:hypothetical protein
MQTEILLKWFHRFIEITMPTERKSPVLLLDGDESQRESLELIEQARKSHVVLLFFLSHTTQRSPLDVSFMDPLNQHYSDGTRKWLQ